jgi:hypothetical protein
MKSQRVTINVSKSPSWNGFLNSLAVSLRERIKNGGEFGNYTAVYWIITALRLSIVLCLQKEKTGETFNISPTSCVEILSHRKVKHVARDSRALVSSDLMDWWLSANLLPRHSEIMRPNLLPAGSSVINSSHKQQNCCLYISAETNHYHGHFNFGFFFLLLPLNHKAPGKQWKWCWWEREVFCVFTLIPKNIATQNWSMAWFTGPHPSYMHFRPAGVAEGRLDSDCPAVKR